MLLLLSLLCLSLFDIFLLIWDSFSLLVFVTRIQVDFCFCVYFHLIPKRNMCSMPRTKKRYKINNQVKWMRRLRFCSSQLTTSFLISYCKKSVPLERHWDTMILINLLSLAVWNSKTNFLLRWNTYKDKYNYCRIQGSKI